MSLTSRDVEEITNKSSKEPRFTSFFVALLRLLEKIPAFRKHSAESYGGLHGAIYHNWDRGDYVKATRIAIFGLKKHRHKKSRFLPPAIDHSYWWSLMRDGADSARHISNSELKETLIDQALLGPKPFEGYDVAFSFLEFSKWKYEERNEEKAFEYAALAANSDTTWGEPDFILGWYALVLGRDGAEGHFDKAIEKDLRKLAQILDNDVCKGFPEITSSLKSKYSIQGVADDPNK